MGCSRCLFDDDVPGVEYDEDGVCNFCRKHEEFEKQYPVSEKKLKELFDKVRGSGKGKYDCVVGLSGGCDSSFLLHLAVDNGLTPIAVNFDNHWDTDIAQNNIKTMVTELSVDVYKYSVDPEEYNDIYRAFFMSNVADLEAPTDIALTAVLYMAAKKFGCKYILNGHSFRTEGWLPAGYGYMDGRYIKGIHKKFGKVKMNTYPNLTLLKWLKWMIWDGIKRVRPLYYVPYDKEEIKEFLSKTYGWEWYGGHHLENKFTKWFGTDFRPRKIGLDPRLVEYSALIRSGYMTKNKALSEMLNPVETDDALAQEVRRKLRIVPSYFEYSINAPPTPASEYPTYKLHFKLLKPLFWVLYKTKKIPKSFYIKYC